MSSVKPRKILVAGDVCLDVIGVPIPPKSVEGEDENWRLTGETRTHFLPGGAMLLAKFIRAASLMKVPMAQAEQEALKQIKEQKLTGDKAEDLRFEIRKAARLAHTRPAEEQVIGPRPRRPAAISGASTGTLYQDDFIAIAERLRRDEIVHSLIGVNVFPTTTDPNGKGTTYRVEKEHGYSGPADPKDAQPLVLEYADVPVEIIVLDDTGNTFRKPDPNNPWPAAIEKPVEQLIAGSHPVPLIIYKLHRPLPSEGPNPLWKAVARNHRDNRVVVVSVEDLRAAGAPISLGLSWERTALDIVWHLLHFQAFKSLCACPRLVVRLGLDGAVLWHRDDESSRGRSQAWLVYDPSGIEGSFALKVPGEMVSCGSAFTAALVQHLSAAADEAISPLLASMDNENVDDLKKKEEENVEALRKSDDLMLEAIKKGLHASRRLLQMGFGTGSRHPNYPGPELFDGGDVGVFCSQPIKMIPGADEPDRSYWRLLDTIFEGEESLLHTAVELTATAQRVVLKSDEADAPNKLKADSPNKRKADALNKLKEVPEANYGALRTYDRCEIEHYRALHTLLRGYLCSRLAQRPLSIGVFGPPGAGKSFGVKEVAASLKGQRDCREADVLTFNLSLYQTPEELVGAFHLVRDVALRGKVPLVFFDEFDTALKGEPLGWLRHFLAPMQDGEFLDRGAPHPLGQAIFVFAGGTCATYREFTRHPGIGNEAFKALKGPDFLSRLRATLDIPSLNFLTACAHQVEGDQIIQPPGTFDPYGPVHAFPCEAAILLRRASILAFNLPRKAPGLRRADGSLAIAREVLRALLRLPQFAHGNRSFEALLDMSHLTGASHYSASLLPPLFQMPLHADAQHLEQLVATDFPFPPQDRIAIAKSIHNRYRQANAGGAADLDWDDPKFARHQTANLEQADDIGKKLRRVGLWFRKISKHSQSGSEAILTCGAKLLEPHLEVLAKAEHDRWSAQKRRQGWAAARDKWRESRNDSLKLHDCLFPWDQLDDGQKRKDFQTVADIPVHLLAAGYEIIEARRHAP